MVDDGRRGAERGRAGGGGAGSSGRKPSGGSSGGSRGAAGSGGARTPGAAGRPRAAGSGRVGAGSGGTRAGRGDDVRRDRPNTRWDDKAAPKNPGTRRDAAGAGRAGAGRGEVPGAGSGSDARGGRAGRPVAARADDFGRSAAPARAGSGRPAGVRGPGSGRPADGAWLVVALRMRAVPAVPRERALRALGVGPRTEMVAKTSGGRQRAGGTRAVARQVRPARGTRARQAGRLADRPPARTAVAARYAVPAREDHRVPRVLTAVV